MTETGQFVEAHRLYVDFTKFYFLYFCDLADFIYFYHMTLRLRV